VDLVHRIIARSPAGLRNLLKRFPGASRFRDRLYGSPSGDAPRSGSLRPVVYLPTWLEWEVMKQRPQYLLEALAAAGHEVWFVDPRLGRPESVDDRIRLVPTIGSTPKSGVIVYTHFAPTRTLIDRYQDPVVVYDVLDDLAIYEPNERGMPVERTVTHHHRPLIEEADVVIASNPVLLERHRSERRDLILVENGVDLDRFKPDGPVEPAGSDNRVIGFHGALALWVDLALMAEVARLRPDLSFRFVGPVDPLVEVEAAKLAALPNVDLLPAQPSSRIAEYVRGFSVGVLPFVINEMTLAVTPLKMYEYMASGIPTVATPLPACVDHPAVYTASNAESFVSGIDVALMMTGGQRKELRVQAEAASWGQRILPLLERLEERGLRTVG
jgi:glycosyltransferase involved in cell wall biosynthesis